MGIQEFIYAAVAAVIAGFMMLAMYAVQLRGQQASIDAVQYRAAKLNLLAFVERLDRDFNNMGAHMYQQGGAYEGEAEDPGTVIMPGWYDSTAVQGGYRTWFQFRSQSDSTQMPGVIRYEWEPIAGESVTLNDGTQRQLYEVKRLLNGALTTSTRLVTDFDITLRPGLGVPFLVNLEDARVFTVQLRGISPLGKGDTIEEVRFDVTYRPIGMTITDNLN